MGINRVKGTYDVLPGDVYKWQYLEEKIRKIAEKYNFKEIRTPIMEYSGVFHRESELSDMVTKETYNFKDKSDREVTLRPEGTAGVIRSYVENKLYAQNDLVKVYYIEQMFRYERPQKGRYRQFMQFGYEAIGSKSALLDAEVIAMSSDFIKSLGLKNVVVEINSIGDNESRAKYQDALVKYLLPYSEKLSHDSKERLLKNPLRILDSKDLEDQEITKNAPKPVDYLNLESREYFDKVLEYLKILNIDYVINSSLVRGLDYYSETVFEVKAHISGFGAQNVLGGGGRYENLVSELGGPKTSAIGVAFGMERLLMALEYEEVLPNLENDLTAFIITLSESEKKYGVRILNELRNKNLKVDIEFDSKSFKSQLKKALSKNARFLIIVGEEEEKSNKVTIKNTKTQEQKLIDINDIKNVIMEKLEK